MLQVATCLNSDSMSECLLYIAALSDDGVDVRSHRLTTRLVDIGNVLSSHDGALMILPSNTSMPVNPRSRCVCCTLSFNAKR